MDKNIKAFLDMVAVSEGTKGKGDDGYNVLCGGKLFGSYAAFPNIKVFIPSLNIYSTAAGRYQINHATYLDGVKATKVKDFYPASQDILGAWLLDRAGVTDLVVAGNINDAIVKAKSTWASFPGAGYGQHEQKLNTLLAAYQAAGGTINN